MEKTMTPEELNDSLILLQNRFALDKSYKLEDYNIDRLSLINQFKEDVLIEFLMEVDEVHAMHIKENAEKCVKNYSKSNP